MKLDAAGPKWCYGLLLELLRTPSVSHQLNVATTLEVVMRPMITSLEDERFHENDEWFHDVTWWLKCDVTHDELCCFKQVCLVQKHVCLELKHVSSLRKNYVLSFLRLV